MKRNKKITLAVGLILWLIPLLEMAFDCSAASLNYLLVPLFVVGLGLLLYAAVSKAHAVRSVILSVVLLLISGAGVLVSFWAAIGSCYQF
jgi:type IV secretory pathway VirB6-like protein